MKWIDERYGTEYNTEAEAYENIIGMIDIYDIADEVGNCEIMLTDIIKELQKYDSPLFYRLLENAQQSIFNAYIYTIDEEEDEEDD